MLPKVVLHEVVTKCFIVKYGIQPPQKLLPLIFLIVLVFLALHLHANLLSSQWLAESRMKTGQYGVSREYLVLNAIVEPELVDVN